MSFCLDYHPCLKGIKHYLSFMNKKLSDFWTEIENTDDDNVMPIIEVLCKYKAYDILIPLNMIVKISMDDSVCKWWKYFIETFGSRKEIEELTDLLYNKLNSMNYIKYPPNVFCSVAILEKIMWEIFCDYFGNIEDFEYFCLYTSGLFAEPVSCNYLKCVDEKVFQSLFKKSEEIQRSINSSPYEIALIKSVIDTYSSEFGAFYYMRVYYMSNSILFDGIQSLENNASDYLTKSLKKSIKNNQRYSFYLTRKFVCNLNKIYNYSKQYRFLKFDSLERCLPVLMQCVGIYKESVSLALSLINDLSVKEKSDSCILLALYIGMFTSSDEVQHQIYNTISGILEMEYGLDKAVLVLKDIVVFFEKFSEELSMRFDSEQLKELKKTDSLFYDMYEYYDKENIESNISYLNDIFWLLKYVFNGKIIEKMNDLYEIISDKNIEYSHRLMATESLSNLFYNLASKLDTEARINISSILDLLDMKSDSSVNLLHNKYEIFLVYNKFQINELKLLYQRLSLAIKSVPQYSSVASYKQNVSWRIADRILELSKEKFGTDSKKFFIV